MLRGKETFICYLCKAYNNLLSRTKNSFPKLAQQAVSYPLPLSLLFQFAFAIWKTLPSFTSAPLTKLQSLCLCECPENSLFHFCFDSGFTKPWGYLLPFSPISFKLLILLFSVMHLIDYWGGRWCGRTKRPIFSKAKMEVGWAWNMMGSLQCL